MKKVLFSMLVALMGVFVVSCTNKTETKAAEENAQEVAEQVSGLDKAKEILNDLKENGANLDAEALKAKLMDFAGALKPEIAKMTELTAEMEKDPSKAAEVMKELESLKEVENLMPELEKSVESIPVWKELEKDEEFGKKFQEALGMTAE